MTSAFDVIKSIKNDKETTVRQWNHAISTGNVEMVKFFISYGLDLNVQDKSGNTPLANACMRYNTEIVKLFIDAGVDLDTQDVFGNTALHKTYCPKIADMLFMAGANLELQNQDKETPLLTAYRNSSKNMVETLVVSGANINCQDIRGLTPLMYAVARGDKVIVELLLNYGAEVEHYTTIKFCVYFYKDEGSAYVSFPAGSTALSLAQLYGYTEIADILTSAKEKEDEMKSYEMEWRLAICDNDVEQAKKLISSGKHLDIETKSVGTPLTHASQKGCLEIAKLLIDAGADLDIQSGDVKTTALVKACFFNHKEVIELLVKSGADVNISTINGYNALIYTVVHNNKEVVELLVNHSASLNLKTITSFEPNEYSPRGMKTIPDGSTALSLAQLYGYTEIADILTSAKEKQYENLSYEDKWCLAILDNDVEQAKKLISSGKHLNVETKSDGTPLMHVSQKGCLEIAKLLIDAGADLDTRCSYVKTTALIQACFNNHIEIIELLVKSGANVNISTTHGYNALIYAVVHNNKEVVELLVNHGASLNLKTTTSFESSYYSPRGMKTIPDGSTALSLAQLYGYTEIVELLTRTSETSETISNSNSEKDVNILPVPVPVRPSSSVASLTKLFEMRARI